MYNYGKRKRLKQDVSVLIDKGWLIEEQFDNSLIDVELLSKDFRKDIDEFIKKYENRLENIKLITDDLKEDLFFRKLFIVVQKLQYFINDGIIRFKKRDNFIIRFFKKLIFERKKLEYIF